MDTFTLGIDWDARARGYDCPQCPATTDVRCTTPNGRRAAHSHEQRVQRAKVAVATPENDFSYNLRARRYACPHCGAGTNEQCRSTAGKAAPHSHRQRVAIAKDQEVRGKALEINASALGRPWYAKPVDGPQVRMAGTTAHVYVPAGTDHIIIGYLEQK
jgi:predicted RNA-binding Zn-ribbon protein involved in translation (DUF1610 family)